MQAFRGTLGAAVRLCRPADPEANGLVERANGYLETSFLPGRVFASPGDFNLQLAAWLVRANGRMHRSIDARPVDRWEPDRAAMLSLPPVPPVVGWRTWLRLPRDHYVRLDANDYSVDPAGWAAGLRWSPTWTRSGCSAPADWSPGTSGVGLGGRPSPTRSTPTPPRCVAHSGGCGADGGNRGAATESRRLRPPHRHVLSGQR
jgi:Mu transposase, C-terminal domain